MVGDISAFPYSVLQPFPPRALGISGEVIRDKILWSDGTWWSQKPLQSDASVEDKN
jgi:hypothetical protein